MASKPKAFIDSNVLANWMLLAGAIDRVKSQGEEKLKELRESAGRKWPSYILLEELKRLGKNQSIVFGTSTFAVAETEHVLLEEYIASRLHQEGVPFEFWESMRKREKLNEDDERDLFKQHELFLRTFFVSPRQILKWFEAIDFFAVGVLITSYRISTTDAYLISGAMRAKCRFFVTEDRALRKLLQHRRIRPISAQAILDELKKTSHATGMQQP